MSGNRLTIRLLRRDDDRSDFRCGEPAIDRFLQHYAGQNQFRFHLAVTWVAEWRDALAGFATVAAGSIDRHQIPSARLRKRLPAYPLPILRLARLGVDQWAQGAGIGRALLRHVFRLALEQRDRLGCVGIVTDAKPPAVSFYESLGFSELPGIREGALHGDPLPMFLPVAALAAALE